MSEMTMHSEPANPGYLAQVRYCDEKRKPVFIYRDARCHNCGRDLFGAGGIPLDEAGKKLITSCPFCNTSFCD